MKRTIFALFIALGTTLALSACGGLAPVPTLDLSRAVTPVPAETLLRITLRPGIQCAVAEVTQIVDGNSIEVRIGSKIWKVHYIGIHAPAVTERMGKDALAANKTLGEGKTVCLENDMSDTDKSGWLLRYVYVDELLVNAELARLGMAQVAPSPPDVKYQALLLRAQQEAYAAGRGLWGGTLPGATGTPPTARTRTPTPANVRRGTPTR